MDITLLEKACGNEQFSEEKIRDEKILQSRPSP
jgi:hypothetical protein